MDLREARAAVLRRHHRDLADDFSRALPRVLDALSAVDAKHRLGPQTPVKAAETAQDGTEPPGTGDEPPGTAQAPQAAPAPARTQRRRTR